MEQTTVKRRSLVAGAAALVAGLMAKQAMDAQPVGAATGGPLVLGVLNAATGTDKTQIENPTASLINEVFRSENFGTALPSVPTNFAIGLTGLASNVGAPNAASFFPIGVYGSCLGGHGAVFQSNAAYGVLGVTTAVGFAGCTGIANVSGTAAFAGGTAVAGAFAAVFNGPVEVNGSFTVNGGPKSAGVQLKDGSHARVYCLEAPDSFFEDVGKAQLAGGTAKVSLDSSFKSIVHSDDYHVFLTPYGETKGLHVTKQTPDGFTVQEGNGGTSNVSFSYRIVAKRSDIKAARFERYTPSNIKMPDPSHVAAITAESKSHS